jgi:hypothetical protein
MMRLGASALTPMSVDSDSEAGPTAQNCRTNRIDQCLELREERKYSARSEPLSDCPIGDLVEVRASSTSAGK